MIAEVKNTADLRRMLLEVIADVRAGRVDAKQARAISALSGNILHSARLDFEVMKHGATQGARPTRPVALTSDDGAGEPKALGGAGAPAKAGAGPTRRR